MYSKNQEKVIFDIVLSALVFFQVATFFAVESSLDHPLRISTLLVLNLLFASAMIPYAKWVWNTPSYKKAILQVAIHEAIILGLSMLAIGAVFIISVESHA